MFHVLALCSGFSEDSVADFAELRSEQRKAKPGALSAMVKNSFVIELPGKL